MLGSDSIKPVKLNEIYQIDILNLNSNAQGVGRIDDFTAFVEGALPAEVVKAKIIEVKKNYAVAELLEILKSSTDRVEPRCPIYSECGGCQLQHLSYNAQLKWKRRQVVDALKRIGKIDVTVKDTLGMKEPWRYRNKMQFPVGRIKSKIQIGCFAKSSHKVVDTDACLIQRQQNDEILQAVRRVVDKFKVSVYDEDKHRGILRHVMGRIGVDETMMVLVTASEKLPNEKTIVRALRNELPNITSIQQNIQTQHNNVILGRETKVLYGKRTIKDKIGNLEFNISARSFFQVNTAQAEKLYQTALNFADLKGHETVIDAFCGTGTITLFLAKHAKFAYGIEIVSSAIADAKLNARNNNVRNVQFITGDATAILPKLGVRPDVMVLDPPRAGCDEKFLLTIAKLKPSRVVYVSCNPATLARDLNILEANGFKTQIVQPVDMFPFTSHVEAVALMLWTNNQTNSI
ncbi:MAG: 23S rRNA (uracil(1939)-C(5))-methyltransferase RlmD [Selenomonadaceae bacterium]|nr:23S rRNA (uracil(1939)-C(5))-methyltransferase RlmD [Selenomonadaceae bacterium]